MTFKFPAAGLIVAVILTGCTAVNTVTLHGRIGEQRQVQITTGDLDRPCRSIGVIQVTLTGCWLFGFIDLVPANLDEALQTKLAAEAARYGADAVINVTFKEWQYPLLLKLVSVATILSPQFATVTGELVEFSE